MNRFSRTSKTQTSPLARLWITMEGEASSEPACDPCLFFFSRRGCTKGSACGYCHFDHSHLQRARRPRRRARERYKRSVLQLLHSQVDLEQIHDELQESSRKNPYLRNFFQEFLDKPDDEQAEASWSVGSARSAACTPAPRVPGLQAHSSQTRPGQLLHDPSGYGAASSSSAQLPEAPRGDVYDSADVNVGRRQ